MCDSDFSQRKAEIELEHKLSLERQDRAIKIAANQHIHHSLMQAGFNASKAILIVSGGSFVAMLAYIGQLKAQDKVLNEPIAIAMLFLGSAAILALLNSGVSYLIYNYYSQNIYKGWPKDRKDFKKGCFFEVAAVLIWCGAFVCLAAGGYYSLEAILRCSLFDIFF